MEQLIDHAAYQLPTLRKGRFRSGWFVPRLRLPDCERRNSLQNGKSPVPSLRWGFRDFKKRNTRLRLTHSAGTRLVRAIKTSALPSTLFSTLPSLAKQSFGRTGVHASRSARLS